MLFRSKLSSYINCRDKDLREIVKTQARAIVSLRESYSSKAKLINGIDAASSEFDARPEVFAVAFRYLKDHKLKGEFNVLKNKTNIVDNKLFATYHAGEDFFDIVDGLRTIDEAIKFLNLRQGDRIGHALALGLNANDYFKFLGCSHACGDNDKKLMELINMKVFDPYKDSGANFEELVKNWITDTKAGYIRV